MKSVNLAAIKSLPLDEVFTLPEAPPREHLCGWSGWCGRIEAKSDGFTIILDRDIVHAVENASAMSIHLANKFPAKKLLLINTYASAELLQSSLVHGMVQARMKVPHRLKKYLRSSEESLDESASLPTNLRVLNCPTSTLTSTLLESEIKEKEYEIIVLNSFEFATLSRYTKSMLAKAFLELQVRHGLTVVIYSQEMRNDIRELSFARGAIGILSAYATAVWRVYDPYEEMQLE